MLKKVGFVFLVFSISCLGLAYGGQRYTVYEVGIFGSPNGERFSTQDGAVCIMKNRPADTAKVRNQTGLLQRNTFRPSNINIGNRFNPASIALISAPIKKTRNVVLDRGVKFSVDTIMNIIIVKTIESNIFTIGPATEI